MAHASRWAGKVCDGEPAPEQLHAHAGGMVVLVDWSMPGMDGAALLRAMAADLPASTRNAYLVLTARARVDAVHACPRALARALPPAAAQVLSKPFNVDYLLAAVGRAASHFCSVERGDQVILPSPVARPTQSC